MFGVEKLTELSLTHSTETRQEFSKLQASIKDMQQLLVRLVVEQNKTQLALSTLEQRIANEKADDREFIMSVITLLKSNSPNEMVKLNRIPDPFEELPIGHTEGYTAEELGVYRQKTEEQTA